MKTILRTVFIFLAIVTLIGVGVWFIETVGAGIAMLCVVALALLALAYGLVRWREAPADKGWG